MKLWLEIRRLEELVFDSLRLSVEDAAEAAAEVAAEVLAEILAEVLEVKASLVVHCLGSSVS